MIPRAMKEKRTPQKSCKEITDLHIHRIENMEDDYQQIGKIMIGRLRRLPILYLQCNSDRK